LDDICARIRRITSDLNVLEMELEWSKIAEASAEEQGRWLDEILSMELVGDFKAAVDKMRHLLWCYIESVATRNGSCNIDYSLQTHRLQRVTEMLQLLRSDGTPELSSLPAAKPFFEQVSAVVETYDWDAKDGVVRKKGHAA
jgi:hypothetical protein